MATVTLTLDEYEALRSLISSERESEGATLAEAPPKKKKRKVSTYGREFGRQLKALKAKHPRTNVRELMGRAHRATKKSMK